MTISYVALHFDCLDLLNATVPLMMPMAPHDQKAMFHLISIVLP